jgi:hypothetical protein
LFFLSPLSALPLEVLISLFGMFWLSGFGTGAILGLTSQPTPRTRWDLAILVSGFLGVLLLVSPVVAWMQAPTSFITIVGVSYGFGWILSQLDRAHDHTGSS